MRFALLLSVALNTVLVLLLVTGGARYGDSNAVPGAGVESRASAQASVVAPPKVDSLREQPTIVEEPAPVAVASETPAAGSTREPQVIDAIPGRQGFELVHTPPPAPPQHPAEALAAEPEDAVWAVAQEADLFQALQTVPGSPNVVDVECRRTRCAVLVALPNYRFGVTEPLPYAPTEIETRPATSAWPLSDRGQTPTDRAARQTINDIHEKVITRGFDGTRSLSDIDLFWTRYPDGRQFAVFYIQLEP
jgi:hypothetical protein